MRIEYRTSTGDCFGQFVVHAENDLERTVLHNFLSADKKEWQFWLHGGTYGSDDDGCIAFNFGWVKK